MRPTGLRAAVVAAMVGVCGAAAATPVIRSVVDGYSLGPLLAPGTYAIVGGTDLPTVESAGATVNGARAAVIDATVPGQWAIEIPADAKPGPATVTIGDSAPFGITLQQYAPVLRLFEPLVLADHGTGRFVTVDNPAFAGETLTLYATGLGTVQPNLFVVAPVGVTVGGVTAQVLSASFLTGRGYCAVKTVVPAMLPTGEHQVALTVAGIPSTNGGLLPVVAAASPTGPVITAVQNGASFQPGMPSGGWISIIGVRLATKTASWTVVDEKLPVELEGVRVSVGGLPAFIAYVSPTQINAVAPTVAAGRVEVAVTNSLGASAVFPITATTADARLFLWPLNYSVATHLDYTYAVRNGVFLFVPTKAAKPGEVIILWANALGPSSPPVPDGIVTPDDRIYAASSAVTVELFPPGSAAGIAATVVGTALAPGFAALWQVAVRIPEGLAAGDYYPRVIVGGESRAGFARLSVEP